jgi:hypothetical protein
MATAETAEEISKKPEVRQALSQTRGPKAGTEKLKPQRKINSGLLPSSLMLVRRSLLSRRIEAIPVRKTPLNSRRFLRGAVLIVILRDC